MNAMCRHCGRRIVNVDGSWVDPEATGDDSVWREVCDAHDTFDAVHEPSATVEIIYTDGTVARWSMSNGDADKLANLIGRSPDTLRT